MQTSPPILDLLSRGYFRYSDRIICRLTPPVPDDLTLPKHLPTPRRIWDRHDGIVILRQVPEFTAHDTPMKSLYRLCEFLCADEPNQVMLEMNYFWSHSSEPWDLQPISDPNDDNHERYALVVSLVESLVLAFNFLQKLGSRRGESTEARIQHCPLWTVNAPSLDHLLNLQRQSGMDNDMNVGSNDLLSLAPTDLFSKRNITANAGNLFSF
ncbi:hypothetical protein Q7P37_000281 [Cladosporium fusiforme]